MQLVNIKTVAERRENMLWFRTPDKVYIKLGCLPVALDELQNILGKRRAFVVTDSYLYQNGYAKAVTDKLSDMGIEYMVFSDVAPDPTLACAQEGAKLMVSFKPDVIIALGAARPCTQQKSCGCYTNIPMWIFMIWQYGLWTYANVRTDFPNWAARRILSPYRQRPGPGRKLHRSS
jgi:hypothetical protein